MNASFCSFPVFHSACPSYSPQGHVILYQRNSPATLQVSQCVYGKVTWNQYYVLQLLTDSFKESWQYGIY